jgi:hypothetical protein
MLGIVARHGRLSGERHRLVAGGVRQRQRDSHDKVGASFSLVGSPVHLIPPSLG